MKLMPYLLCSLFTLNVSAGALLSCKSHNFNPYYYFKIKTDETEFKTGSLVRAINGFVGEEHSSLWSDPVDFNLESYTCELAIYSLEKSLDEFAVSLNLNKLINEKYSGTIIGSLIEVPQNISCTVLEPEMFKRIKSNCTQ